RYARQFLIAILLIAILAGIGWRFVAPERALWIAISVIVVTCPCALSLATPGVMAAAIGQMAKHGMLVTKGRAVETLAKVSHFVFDKTGTLTIGALKVTTQIDCKMVPHLRDAKIAALLASMSLHPVAKAIANHFGDLAVVQKGASNLELLVESSREIAGAGVELVSAGKIYRLGKPEFVLAISATEYAIPAAYLSFTTALFGDEKGVIACFVLQDSVRPEARQAISDLLTSGMEVLLLSGDAIQVVEQVAGECGITHFQAALSPAQKQAEIQRLQNAGAVVAMVGDGMNDGPALSLANIGIAMGQGAPISQTRSDCVLISNRLSDLSFSVRIAKFSYRIILQNIAWAMVYNLVAIPAAVLGYLEPWHAALGMTLSSLLVVLNGLRVLRVKE
ncbi:MAG: HAD-IC family P-type ATPase, partial [Undibacterium sp.]|nr:HAD-IC family P-type ATPase [Undibacterium sp.]